MPREEELEQRMMCDFIIICELKLRVKTLILTLSENRLYLRNNEQCISLNC
jgi:hypothetical protein